MKITIANNVALVTTSIAKEDYAKVLKWRPELLEIKDAESKNIVFKTALGSGDGSVSKYGATLVEGVNGKLGLTIPLEVGMTVNEAKARVYDTIGAAFTSIEKIEKNIADNIGAINEAETTFMAGITVNA